MLFRSLTLCLALYTSVSFAQGRKPAVEDFVGIEVEETKVTPTGTESLFNLQQDINRIEAEKNRPAKQAVVKEAPAEFSPSVLFGISLALFLPMITWFLVMAHLKKKASLENASNIEVLEKYRKEREKKVQEETRKVS